MCLLQREKLQRLRYESLHVFPVDDGVNHTVLDKKFAALEAVGEFLTDRLLNYTWPGKPDEGARLGNIEIAEHGETGSDAARRRVCENRYVRKAFLVEARQSR